MPPQPGKESGKHKRGRGKDFLPGFPSAATRVSHPRAVPTGLCSAGAGQAFEAGIFLSWGSAGTKTPLFLIAFHTQVQATLSTFCFPSTEGHLKMQNHIYE